MFSAEYIYRSNQAATVHGLWDLIENEGGYFGDILSEVECEWLAEKSAELIADCPWEVKDFFEQSGRGFHDTHPASLLDDFLREYYFDGDMAEWPEAVLDILEDEARKALAELRGVNPDDTLEGVDEDEEEA
jgi:hypothetical protein